MVHVEPKAYILFQLFHQFAQLRFEFRSHRNEVQLATRSRTSAGREQHLQQTIGRFLHQVLERRMQSVVVLLDELVRIIANRTGKVAHQKALLVAQRPMRLQPRRARQRQSIVVVPRLVHLGGEVRERRLGQFRLFVEQRENADGLGLDQLDDVLVVGELDLGHVQTFAPVQLLLVLQNVVVEELLQFLVAVVDAKLLKRVGLEVFCKAIEGVR